MSKRTSIVKALAKTLNDVLDGTNNSYNTNIYKKAATGLKFWDEVQEFPAIFVVPGTETREYHPAEFIWGYLNVSIKLYVKGDTAQEQLELLIEDCENVINSNRSMMYDSSNDVTEITINSIITDEGLLSPYGVGEINLQVRYQLM